MLDLVRVSSPLAAVGSESASWNTASYWSDRTDSSVWNRQKKKGHYKLIQHRTKSSVHSVTAGQQYRLTVKSVTRSASASGSYFLNCSWKRSLWPWRVSAGRPAGTHKTETRLKSAIKNIHVFHTWINNECTGGWWDLKHESVEVGFSGTEKRRLETELKAFEFFRWCFERFQMHKGSEKFFFEEQVISESLQERCLPHFWQSHTLFLHRWVWIYSRVKFG